MGDRTEFRVLGPLQVVIDGESVRLGGPRPRGLLAVLLVHAGEPVSAERLVDQLWGDEPPPTASTALQVHVSALRKVLGDRLVRTAAGYRLRVADGELDAARFETAVANARRELTDRPEAAVAGFHLALASWRGEPYAGVPDSSDVEAARQRLSELRLCTVEDRLAAELALGRHARLDEARAPIDEALLGYRKSGNRRGEADALANLGHAAERAGEPARELYLASLAVYRELDFDEGKVEILEALGRLEVVGRASRGRAAAARGGRPGAGPARRARLPSRQDRQRPSDQAGGLVRAGSSGFRHR